MELNTSVADPFFTLMRIRILFFYQSDANLRPLVYYGPPWLHFEPQQLLNFDFDADPDPAFHPNADADPVSQNDADPDPQNS